LASVQPTVAQNHQQTLTGTNDVPLSCEVNQERREVGASVEEVFNFCHGDPHFTACVSARRETHTLFSYQVLTDFAEGSSAARALAFHLSTLSTPEQPSQGSLSVVGGRRHKVIDSHPLFRSLGLLPHVIFDRRILVKRARHSFTHITAASLKHSRPVAAHPIARPVPSNADPANLVADQLLELAEWAIKVVFVSM
jgi:hypothetical protein